MAEDDVSDWSAGTYAGARRATRDAVSGASAQQPLAWLEQTLKLAAVSGALSQARRDSQRRCEAAWESSAPQDVVGPTLESGT